MIFKVITITFITTCAADNRMLLPNRTTEQEVPAQRFSRHDIPILNKKYDNVNSYNIPSWILRSNNFRKIQYAPLHNRKNQKNKIGTAEYAQITSPLSSAYAKPTGPFPDKSSHLEPREKKIPGHSVEDLLSVSRSPGHNAVYRKFPPEPSERDKPYKINNYIRPKGINLNKELFAMTITPLDLSSENVHPNATLTVQPVVDKTKRQHSAHTKLHRLHLNIARVRSPLRVLQSSAFTDTYSRPNFRRMSLHSQAYITPVLYNLPSLSQKTILFPVKDKQLSHHFRLA